MTTTIERSITIDAPPEQVWQVAAHEFDRVGEWTSQVEVSSPNRAAPVPDDARVGGRVCVAPGFGDIKETITRYSEQGRTFTYAAEGLPGFVTQMDNTWTVSPVGADRAKVTMRVEMDTNAFPGKLMAPIMKRKLASAIGIFQDELKLWVERGELSPAKRKLNAKRAKKAA